MGYEQPLTGAQRVAKRRAALRAQGLRPKTFWLPDTRTPEFQEQARHVCRWLRENGPQWDDEIDFAQALAAGVIADFPLPWTDEE